MSSSNPSSLPYRRCVGIALFNASGKVWLGRRIAKAHDAPDTHIWQMPQGGIDRGEEPLQAALRELAEETGVTSTELLGATADWLTYDLPPHLVGVALRGRYRGQRQMWFAMRFTGEETEIDIGPKPRQEAEFDDWRWEDLRSAAARIVPFKRGVYERVACEFAQFAQHG